MSAELPRNLDLLVRAIQYTPNTARCEEPADENDAQVKRLQNLKKHLPTPSEVREYRYLHIFGDSLKQTELWTFNRSSTARGIAIGLFCAFLPMPFEMVMAAFMAAMLKGNLPFAVAGVWISNPLTWIPMYTPPYLMGASLLNLEPVPLDEITLFELGSHYVALWLGCLLVGTVLALSSHFLISFFWRSQVKQRWKQRQLRRKNRSQSG